MQSIVRWVSILSSLAISAWLVAPRIIQWNILPDFTLFWAAAKFALNAPHQAYDITAMGAAQAWAIAPSRGPRPFPYPPSALLLIAPFGLLSFWTAFWTWTVLSMVAFWSAVRRVTSGWAVPLAMAMPHPVLVLLLGQTTLFASSAAIWAISLLNKRPAVAGLLFGLVAAFKPQTVLLAPIVFVRLRDWRCAIGAAAAFGGLSAASLVLGAALWPSWLTSVWSLPKILSFYHLEIIGATPRMAAIGLHLQHSMVLTIQIAGVLLGVAIVWFGFRSTDALVRVQYFTIGCLLASPYGMRYEIAMLAPVLATAMITAEPRSILIALPAYAFDAASSVGSLSVSAATSIYEQLRSCRSSIWDERPQCVPCIPRTGGSA